MTEQTIALNGNLVVSYIQEIEDEVRKIIDSGSESIVIDFAKTELVDSAGIGLLVKIRNTLAKRNGMLKVVNLNEKIEKMFRMMNLNRHIEF